MSTLKSTLYITVIFFAGVSANFIYMYDIFYIKYIVQIIFNASALSMVIVPLVLWVMSGRANKLVVLSRVLICTISCKIDLLLNTIVAVALTLAGLSSNILYIVDVYHMYLIQFMFNTSALIIVTVPLVLWLTSGRASKYVGFRWVWIRPKV